MAQDKPPNRDCAPGPPRPWETVKGVPRQSGYAVTVTKPSCALACLVVLVLHLRSSVQVVVVDGTQGSMPLSWAANDHDEASVPAAQPLADDLECSLT